jgi:signal peptidase
MKILKKIGKIVLQVVPYLFFAISLVLIFDIIASLKNNETPSLFGYGAAVVKTNSMEDTIMVGDLIFIHEVDPDTLVVGDIITFWKPDADPDITITHRIVEITETPEGRLFSTAGDNTSGTQAFETDFSEDFIIGVYVARSPILGWIYSRIYALFEATGITIIYPFIIIIFLLIAVSETKSIVKELSETKKKQLEAEKARLVAEELERLRQRSGDEPKE